MSVCSYFRRGQFIISLELNQSNVPFTFDQKREKKVRGREGKKIKKGREREREKVLHSKSIQIYFRNRRENPISIPMNNSRVEFFLSLFLQKMEER